MLPTLHVGTNWDTKTPQTLSYFSKDETLKQEIFLVVYRTLVATDATATIAPVVTVLLLTAVINNYNTRFDTHTQPAQYLKTQPETWAGGISHKAIWARWIT